MEYLTHLLAILCLSLCSSSVLAVVDHPVGFYGVPTPAFGPEGVYYEGYGPDQGPGTFLAKDLDGLRKYSYDYGVSDPHTGDHKKVWEIAYGNGVKGGYSLIEPDGTERIVEYTADDVNGFNAVVKRIGPAQHPVNYEKPSYPSYVLPVEAPPVAPVGLPLVVPYKNYFNSLYKNGFYGPGAYSYQNIEQYY